MVIQVCILCLSKLKNSDKKKLIVCELFEIVTEETDCVSDMWDSYWVTRPVRYVGLITISLLQFMLCSPFVTSWKQLKKDSKHLDSLVLNVIFGYYLYK